MVQLTLIAAIGQNNELGFQDDLIWKISEDLKNFKRLTLGHHLLMGRKTFESIGKPLPGRTTLVLSRAKELQIEGVEVVSSFEHALEICQSRNINELMVCGGGELYAQLISKAHKLYLSHIHATSQADTFFPEIIDAQWQLMEKTDHLAHKAQPAWSLAYYQRRSK